MPRTCGSCAAGRSREVACPRPWPCGTRAAERQRKYLHAHNLRVVHGALGAPAANHVGCGTLFSGVGMRISTLLVGLVFAGCAGAAADSPLSVGAVPVLPGPGPSYTFGDPLRPDGGRLVVGLVVERRDPIVLSTLVDAADLEAFLAEEARRADEPEPPPAPEEPEVVEWERVPEPAWGGGARRLASVGVAFQRETGVELQYRELLAHECADVPVALVEQRALHPAERRALEAWQASGGRLVTVADFADPEGVAEALREVLAASPLIRRLGTRPDVLVSARREGDHAIARFAAPPAAVSLHGSDGLALPGATLLDDAQARFPATVDDAELTRRFLAARWEVDGVTIRRAWPLNELVDTVAFEVQGTDRALAGGTWAARVRVFASGSDRPVPGHALTVEIVRGEAVLGTTRAVSDDTGRARVRLAIPADVAPGPATLRIGGVEHPLRIDRQVRLSLVTDRALYEPNDTVHARVLVFAWPAGTPVDDAQVAFKLGDEERTARTSPHGIAAVRFDLADAIPGKRTLEARCEGASAKSTLRVEAIERPRFTLRAEPASLTLRPGEEAPVTITARMVNGAPLVGAKVGGSAARGVTDEHGCFAWTVRAAEGSGSESVVVTDTDGRTQTIEIPVHVERRAPLVVTPLVDLVAGLDARFLVSGEPGEAVVLSAGGRVVFAGELGESGTARFAMDTVVPGLAFETRDGTLALEVAARPEDGVLLRPDRRVATQEETLALTVVGPDGALALDVLRDGVLLRALDLRVVEGIAHAELALERDLVGVLTLRARLGDAESRADVLVLRDDTLSVELEPDADTYEPGGSARVAVQVRDHDARPVTAALGWWAVDEALLALAPMPDGHELVFASLPDAPDAGLRAVAHTGRGAPFVEARAALGALHAGIVQPVRGEFRLRSTDAMRERVAVEAKAALVDHLDRLRAGVVEAFRRVPLRDLRSASGLRDRLDDFVAREVLDPALLVDPWGTPLALWHDIEGGNRWYYRAANAAGEATAHWISAGPDLAFGTSDDAVLEWWLDDLYERLPGPVLRYLEWLMEHASPDELEEWFGTESMNGAIGIGGGAGGGFRGRAGGRSLRMQGGAALAPPPARADFRPTLRFVPEQFTDGSGRAVLDVPLADSITAWTLRVVASDLRGAVGVATTRLVSSRPLYAEPRIAPHLTVGDALELPVALRNETEAAFDARVVLSVGEGLEIRDDAQADLRVEPGRTAAHRFAIRAGAPGRYVVRIEARGGGHADAIERIVTVHPDGRRVETAQHGRVAADEPWRVRPDRTGAATVTLYPSALSELVGGFEGLIGEPHGCFEQTSSTLFPMVLALELMQRAGADEGSLPGKARDHVDSGYRRLLGFEVPGSPGGFSLFGHPAAKTWLTAYGLMEFVELRRVHPVDEALVPRVVAFLRSRQADDGSWGVGAGTGAAHAENWTSAADLALTAWCSIALRDAGEPAGTERAWLAARAGEADEPLAMALAALALGDGEANLRARLAALQGADGSWPAKAPTGAGARGHTASIEATAIAIRALLDDSARAGAVERGLAWLLAQRDANGRFGTTQSTVQALKTLIAADARRGTPARGRVVVRSGERVLGSASIEEGACEPVRIELGVVPPQELTVELVGEGSVRGTLGVVSFASWDEPPAAPAGARTALTIEWPAGPLLPGEESTARVVISNPSAHPARVVTAEIGLPPGCDVDRTAVRGDDAQAVEKGDRHLVIYLDDLPAGERRSFEIPFTPRHALDVKTAPSRVYEYYVPEETVVVVPARVTAR